MNKYQFSQLYHMPFHDTHFQTLPQHLLILECYTSQISLGFHSIWLASQISELQQSLLAFYLSKFYLVWCLPESPDKYSMCPFRYPQKSDWLPNKQSDWPKHKK